MAVIENFNERLFARFLEEVKAHRDTGIRIVSVVGNETTDREATTFEFTPGARHENASMVQILLSTELPTLAETYAEYIAIPTYDDSHTALRHAKHADMAISTMVKKFGGIRAIWALVSFAYQYSDDSGESTSNELTPLIYGRDKMDADGLITVLEELQNGDVHLLAARIADSKILSEYDRISKSGRRPSPSIQWAVKIMKDYL